jgi:hypothetical protein
LADRYLVDRLTAEQIGVLCGWSGQYVRDRLRDHGIPLRRRGTHPGLREVDRDTLAGWLRQGLSVRQIADRCGYSVTGVRRLLRRFELTLPPRAAESRAVVGDDRVVGELVRMYQQEGRSMAGIT